MGCGRVWRCWAKGQVAAVSASSATSLMKDRKLDSVQTGSVRERRMSSEFWGWEDVNFARRVQMKRNPERGLMMAMMMMSFAGNGSTAPCTSASRCAVEQERVPQASTDGTEHSAAVRATPGQLPSRKCGARVPTPAHRPGN